jgi:hypothetical protein
VLKSRGIPHHLDDWGPKGGHEWPYWHHQMWEYVGAHFWPQANIQRFRISAISFPFSAFSSPLLRRIRRPPQKTRAGKDHWRVSTIARTRGGGVFA